MMAWLAINLNVFVSTIRRMLRSPFSNFFSICVIGIALSLPTGTYVLFENFQSFSSHFNGSPQISLFLDTAAKPEQVKDIAKRLAKDPGVDHYRFVPKSEAFERFRNSAEYSDVTAGLAENPLPDVYIVFAKDNSSRNLEGMRTAMSAWPEVAHVQLDSEWVRKLDSLLKLGQVATAILAVLLGAALIFITFNTIRLHILTQKDEIEVAKLIGATNTFIRRPFLYLGAIQGLAGGIAAWSIIATGLHFLNDASRDLAQIYSVKLALSNLDATDTLFLLALSSLLGWTGAWLSVTRHLWQMDWENHFTKLARQF
ncbi:MAG: ABC transporter permease [Burkholderiales bacterium]|nr:ABC transporter permease [Burkholderiales bacterium]